MKTGGWGYSHLLTKLSFIISLSWYSDEMADKCLYSYRTDLKTFKRFRTFVIALETDTTTNDATNTSKEMTNQPQAFTFN